MSFTLSADSSDFFGGLFEMESLTNLKEIEYFPQHWSMTSYRFLSSARSSAHARIQVGFTLLGEFFEDLI